jgi:hypothetical protein
VSSGRLSGSTFDGMSHVAMSHSVRTMMRQNARLIPQFFKFWLLVMSQLHGVSRKDDLHLMGDEKSSVVQLADDREIRCPRLGGQVTFGYCRQEALGKPCFKAIDCWHSYFEAEMFFRSELGDDVFEQIFHAIPKPRLVTLVDLIAKARRMAETAGDPPQEKSVKKI